MINTLRPHAAQLLVALKKTIPAVLLLGSLSLGLAPSARAQITLTFQESGSDVQALYTGSWATFSTSLSEAVTVLGGNTDVFYAMTGSYEGYLTSPTVVTLPFTSFIPPGEHDGANFGFDPEYIYGPSGYVNGTTLTGSLIFPNTNFILLGMTLGSSGVVDYGEGNVVNWSVSAVPEPSTYAAFLGLAAMGFAATRRRRRAA